MPEQDNGSLLELTKSDLLTSSPEQTKSRKPSPVELLQREYEYELENRARESVLSRAITTLLGAKRADGGLESLKAAAVSGAPENIKAAVTANRQARLWEHDVAEIGTAVLKTGALFIRGRPGYAAAAVVFGLDSIKPGSSLGQMALDGSLGVGKGLANKGFLEYAHGKNWSLGKTGVLLGGVSRLSDSALTRQTYLDKDGNFDLSLGGQRVALATFNPAAIAMDYALFKFAGYGVQKADKVLGGRLSENPFMRNVATAQIFGLSTGFSGEALRQMRQDDFDPARLLTVTLSRGLADSFAAMPGSYLSYRQPAKLETSAQTTLKGLRAMDEPGTNQMAAMLKAASETGMLKAATDASLAGTRAQQKALPNESLGASEQRSEPVYKLKAEQERKAEGDYASWRRLNLEESGTRQMEIYRTESGVEIAVPKAYNETLGQLRAWRAENPGKEMPKDHPLYEYRDRALPEDIARALENTPNQRLFKRVNLLDEESPVNEYFRQKDPEHRSAAESTDDGVTSLYKTKLDRFLEEDVMHEWTHLFKWQNPELNYLFAQAAKVEAKGEHARDYAKTSVEENFAVHAAEELASTNSARAKAFADAAPVRAAVILRSLQEALDASPAPKNPSERRQALERNLKELLEPTLAKAKQELLNEINQGADPVQIEAAVKSLLLLGEAKDLAQIQKVIPRLNFNAEPVSPEVLERISLLPKGVKELSLNASLVADEMLGGIGRLPALSSLSLRRTNITNWGLGELSLKARVQNLDLSETSIDGSSMAYIAKMRPELLDLRGTEYTAADVARLQAILGSAQIKR